jgi:AcrR family transcriptional regulator
VRAPRLVRDEREESILAAARHALAERGFDSTRIVDIARGAGVSTGTVHYHFKTKDDVLLAALRWANEIPYRRLEAALEEEGDSVSRLALLIDVTVPYPGWLREQYLLWIELVSRVLRSSELRPETHEVGLRWRRYFREVIEEGERVGAFHPVAAADEVAERLVALADGLAFRALSGDVAPERAHELLRRFAAEQLGVAPASLEAHGTAERLSA